ncbi:MAG: hypothetical protein B7Y43_01165 [Sphingomonas sp. 28-62-20]|uniref:DUF3572 family protein n=1 Tax=Sphingomonas sp. 28-62-20 TaxID=1970433 RepID=UPI000BDAC1DF|nr:MAG: hypothetical protein B7Y43_01165 [Sphingomonas sp. 28-62-20]
MRGPVTNEDATVLALGALGWALAVPERAERLLALTGLDPQRLRAGAGDPATQAAILGYLEGHEPDLIACATALATTPAALVRARQTLEDR